MDFMGQYTKELEELRMRQSPEFNEVQAMDEEVAEEARQALAQQTDQYFKNSNIATAGPDRSAYDYESMVGGGGSLMPDPDRGVRLPNQYIRPHQKMAGGFDVATGERVFNDVMDPMGIAQEGAQMLGLSYNETDFGSPIEDLNGLSRIAYSVIDQGGGFADFADNIDPMWTDDHKRLSYQAASQAKLRVDLEGFYESERRNPTMQPVTVASLQEQMGEETIRTLPPEALETIEPTDTEEIDPATLPDNQEWLRAARNLYRGIKGKHWQGNFEDLSDWALQNMGMFNWNTAFQAMYTARAMTGDYRLKKAMLDCMNIYDRLGSSWGGAGRATLGILTDPTTYIGFGAGKVASKIGAIAAKSTLKKILISSLAGAAASGLESGITSAADEAMRQSIEVEGGEREEIDMGEIAKTGLTGTAFGTVLGGGLGALGSDPASKFGRKMIDQAQKKWRSTGFNSPMDSELREMAQIMGD